MIQKGNTRYKPYLGFHDKSEREIRDTKNTEKGVPRTGGDVLVFFFVVAWCCWLMLLCLFLMEICFVVLLFFFHFISSFGPCWLISFTSRFSFFLALACWQQRRDEFVDVTQVKVGQVSHQVSLTLAFLSITTHWFNRFSNNTFIVPP